MSNLDDVRHELAFTARSNMYYHQGMEREYNAFISWTALVSVVFAGTAFAALIDIIPELFGMDSKMLGAVITFAIFILNGFVLAFNMFGKYNEHVYTKRRWLEVERKAQQAKSEKDLQALQSEAYTIHQEESAPVRWRLNRAYQRACRSFGLSPNAQYRFWHSLPIIGNFS